MKKRLKKVLQMNLSKAPTFLPVTGGLLVLLLAMYVLLVIGFVELADEVNEGELVFDRVAMAWVQQWHTAGLTELMRLLTEAGGVIGVGLLTVLSVSVYALRGHLKASIMVGASVLGALVINLTLKGIFERERPHFWEHFVYESGYSFPSGHAMASAALAISLMFLLWRTRYRWWALGGGIGYMLLVGISRMYLGVHYPTDIIAGWSVSFLWVSLVAFTLYEFVVFRASRGSGD